MNFFKKISPKFVAFLIFVYLLFIFTGCSSTPSTKHEIDLDLVEFNDTYINYAKLVVKHDALVKEIDENMHEFHAIENDLKNLDLTMDFFLLKREIFKLSQNALDIFEEQQEILDKLRGNLYDQSNTISKLQGNVVKITGPSKKLLAQEIADKLRELNNLKFEVIKLVEKEAEVRYSNWEDLKSFSLDKMTIERALKNKKERIEKLEEEKERLEEIDKVHHILLTEISDLKAKLDSLGP